MPNLSDREVLDAMESALTLLGTANGATVRGDSVLQAARKNLATLIFQLSGAVGSDIYDQSGTRKSNSDPSTLQ